MKAILVLAFCLLLFTSCNKNEALRPPIEKETIATQSMVQENSELRYYIFAKVSSIRLQEIKRKINQFNDDIGLESLSLSSILIAEPREGPYILLRGFRDQNHAIAYKEEFLKLPIGQEFENMMVLTQEGYRKFVMENSRGK